MQKLSIHKHGLALIALAVALAAPIPASAGMPIDEAQEQALLSQAGKGFKIKRTAHFLIAYDTRRSVVNEFTSRLEFVYSSVYRFCDRYEFEAFRPKCRLEVLFFNEPPAYYRYIAAVWSFSAGGTYGVYSELENRSAFFNVINEPALIQLHADILASRKNLDQLTQAMKNIQGSQTPVEVLFPDGRRVVLSKRQVKKKIKESQRELKSLDRRRKNFSARINRMVIQHEIAHQVLFNTGAHIRGARNPRWLVEGLACLFETPPGRTGAGIGTVNKTRLEDFRSAIRGKTNKRKLTSADFRSAVASGSIVSPRELISNQELLGARGQNGATNYAVAWALTHYVQRKHRDQLAKYMKAVRSREIGVEIPPEAELALFERHFGPLDETFLRRWGEYILKIGR